jgi:hypothetical protein
MLLVLNRLITVTSSISIHAQPVRLNPRIWPGIKGKIAGRKGSSVVRRMDE